MMVEDLLHDKEISEARCGASGEGGDAVRGQNCTTDKSESLILGYGACSLWSLASLCLKRFAKNQTNLGHMVQYSISLVFIFVAFVLDIFAVNIGSEVIEL